MSAVMNRRNVLMGLAAVPTVAAPAAVTASPIEAEERQTLIKAWEDFRAAEAEYYAAKDALEWLADEWKHLWPRAPESARWHGSDGIVEADIAGRSYRDERGYVISLKTLKELARGREWVEAQQPRKRVKDRAKEEQRLLKWKREWLAEIDEAEAYYDRIAKLRTAAGAEAANKRVDTALVAMTAAATRVSKEPARTLYGVRLKADAVLGTMEAYGIKADNSFIGDAQRLADAVMNMTAALDGGAS